MKTVALRCNQCGANLELPGDARFVTCQHCDASLEVKREGGAAYTSLADDLERVERKVDEIGRSAQVVELQHRLERLDREWAMQHEQLKIRESGGQSTIPGQRMALVMGVVVTGFGLFWTVMAISIGAPIFFALFGVAFIAFGLLGAVRVHRASRRYEELRRRFAEERARVARQLDEAQRGD